MIGVQQLVSLYDAGPLVLAMTGGPRAGAKVPVPGMQAPSFYLFAVQPELPVTAWIPDGESPSPMTMLHKVDRYEFTGRISDDGTRIYRYTGRY